MQDRGLSQNAIYHHVSVDLCPVKRTAEGNSLFVGETWRVKIAKVNSGVLVLPGVVFL